MTDVLMGKKRYHRIDTRRTSMYRMHAYPLCNGYKPMIIADLTELEDEGMIQCERCFIDG